MTVTTGVDCHDVRHELASMIAERFGIKHTTLPMGHDSDAPLQIRDLTQTAER